ncbi:GntR family transcriptional regulator [uncultured Pelagimonas sp.]|uniref:GntR family transcriptional regulator n=1 Tax=uncultured Pelagimonas sp. TaxID=1618102 RepID=UPI002609F58D|nr:GntR family transcriptional regulator [uncultured Pelagimonas sp.]
MAKISSGSVSIYERLLADIGAGVFPGGTRLKVQDLATRYGTSIIPVREALRLLQGEGIVDIAQNKGATVSSFDADSLRDIFEVLQLMEPYFVETFARSCTLDDIEALQAIQDQIEDTPVENKQKFTSLDLTFHEVIARKHYNARAFNIWQLQRRILNALAMSVPISRARHADILREHRELITAFRENDKDGALACIERHVRGAGDQMYLQLKTNRT